MYARLLLFLGLILIVGFAPAPLPRRDRTGNDRRPTLERMQGWWQIVSEREYGRPGRDARSSNLRLRVKGDSLQYFLGESGADAWTITVDDSTIPPALDKMPLGSPKGTKPSLMGRVEVKGEVLKIGWVSQSERPKDLSGERGVAITFRRERR
jgi:uncharacterized protein (TIGR03067 family)